MNINKKKHKKFSKDDLTYGFAFMNFVFSKGINPFDIIGDKKLTSDLLEEYNKNKNEGVGNDAR